MLRVLTILNNSELTREIKNQTEHKIERMNIYFTINKLNDNYNIRKKDEIVKEIEKDIYLIKLDDSNKYYNTKLDFLFEDELFEQPDYILNKVKSINYNVAKKLLDEDVDYSNYIIKDIKP